MAMVSTLPLTEMSTRRISWGQIQPMLKADNLTTSPYLVMKSGNLNFLEPSGPLQACNGTDLPLPLPLQLEEVVQKGKMRFSLVSDIDYIQEYWGKTLRHGFCYLLSYEFWYEGRTENEGQ